MERPREPYNNKRGKALHCDLYTILLQLYEEQPQGSRLESEGVHAKHQETHHTAAAEGKLIQEAGFRKKRSNGLFIAACAFKLTAFETQEWKGWTETPVAPLRSRNGS
ncbi:hypothetical protein AOLI_G00266590 [Acnodon oligacanthus]